MLEKRLVCASPSPSLISHRLSAATPPRLAEATNSLRHAREMQLLVVSGAEGHLIIDTLLLKNECVIKYNGKFPRRLEIYLKCIFQLLTEHWSNSPATDQKIITLYMKYTSTSSILLRTPV